MDAFHDYEIIESALKNNDVSLIFIHSQHSDNPAPGQSDRAVTRELVHVGSIMEIMVLYHIIICDNTYFSFVGEGLIREY